MRIPNDLTSAEVVKAIDLEFMPTVPIFNDTYFDIKFPNSVRLPGRIESPDQASQMIID